MPFTPITLPFVLTGLGLAMPGGGSGDVRLPAVAGEFYPKSETVLRAAVEAFLADAMPALTKHPLAIVVPHAGYIYSGQICADGWNQARSTAVDTVVFLGTNHTAPDLRKVALYAGDGFLTPLGTAATDKALTEALLAASPDCLLDNRPHLREHSIEVQIPFAQVLFPQAKIVAGIVGAADVALCLRFGKALAQVLAGRHALIVASSDLSHYPEAAEAERVDQKTLAAIAGMDPAAVHAVIRQQEARRIANLHTCACGEAPIMAAMGAAQALGATGGRVVSYAHSGDLPIGEQDRVVGYGTVVFAADMPKAEATAPQAPPTAGKLTPADQKGLLALVRKTISQFLTTQTVPLPRGFSPAAQEQRGVFVTLKKRGNLRGCIGRMVPDRPLATLVGAMALQSAFEDPRFSPVKLPELPNLRIEISVLTPMQPVSGADAIVVGRDGVLLQKGNRSAVFLPQVAPEQGWGRDEMLDNLSMKAGLPASAWREGAHFSTFQAHIFSEAE